MKIIFSLFFCIIAAATAVAQTETGIKEIYLARADANGKPGERSESFITSDVPVFCVIQLNESKSVTVKMNFVAVKTADWKPETNVVSLSYKTTAAQNGVTFDAAPEKRWSPGTYRVDISLDGKPAASKTFEIAKSPQDAAAPPEKPKSAPKRKPLRGKKLKPTA